MKNIARRVILPSMQISEQDLLAIAEFVFNEEIKLFLFDEPLSNLDAKLRIEMRTEIKRLHQAVGKRRYT